MTDAAPLSPKALTILWATPSTDALTADHLAGAKLVFEAGITTRGGQSATLDAGTILGHFKTPLDALNAAFSIQQILNADDALPPFAIGIHRGDTAVSEDETRTIAASVKAFAPAGGIAVTRHVVDHTRGRVADFEFHSMGRHRLDGAPADWPIYTLIGDGIGVTPELAEKQMISEYGAQTDPRVAFSALWKRAASAVCVLMTIDILMGPGADWTMLMVAAIILSVLLRWRSLRH